ncbi:MAG: methylmalonyl-CoA mutase [Deltaproteobacteria bacterium]|nr:methylmalonyl-CoA mutase [Deltaproteobacteria bacterium]MBW2044098.1 methylmalonyl-CoA mutase [Deltaproteobacteria bacterium]MBW2301486.1 methylmalonyl-CoA mutase [Deltaproteobacteria bacterium]
MFDKKFLDELKRRKKEWEDHTLKGPLDEPGERQKEFVTDSLIPVRRLYTPLDLEEVNFDYFKDLGFPGEFPFLRGLDPLVYRGNFWTMMQYSGFASAEETNRRFKYVLGQGATSFSIALDLPTHKALDSDDPLAEGEVGKTGVPIDSLKDMEIIFEGIPLDKVKMFICVAMCTGPIVLGLFLALAEKRGVDPNSFGLFLTNESLMEFACRGTQFTTPVGHQRLSTDVVEYCTKYHPNFSPLQISGYHAREAGATAIQELAFPLANAIVYVQEMQKRGFSIDDFAGNFSWFFSSSLELLEEVAKFRAFRKIWAMLAKERFGAKDPRTLQARIMIYTGGSNLTRQQPRINIVRTTVQALAAALGGVQWMNLSSFDEAYQTPTEEGATIALRTQQILANETGITKTVDPLAGCYYVERLTKEIEEGVKEYLDKIERMGGAVKAIEKGFYQSEIHEQAFRYNREIESKERVKVGVNEYVTDEKVKVAPLKYDPNAEKKTVNRLRKLKQERDNQAVQKALEELRRVTESEENVVPAVINAVKTYATVGEIGAVFRQVYGPYMEEAVYF